MSTLDRTLFQVKISETSRNREYWATRPWMAPNERHDVRSADIIFVPWEDFREDYAALFPQGSGSYFQNSRKYFADKLITIAVERDQYREIALHAREWRLPTLLISAVLLPALANLLATQADKWISGFSKEDTVEMEVIIEGHKGRCISIWYKGPHDRLAETLVEQAGRCLPEAPVGTSEEAER